MSSLKDLKTRIASVKSTQKITKAMKVVAAAKLRRAREEAEAAAPYAQSMEKMLRSLAQNVSGSDMPELLGGHDKEDTHLIVVVSSDRGLCGAFNASLAKSVKQQVTQYEAAGKSVKILCIGKKIDELIKPIYGSRCLESVDGLSRKKTLVFNDAQVQADKIIDLFDSHAFDTCSLIYNRFVSAIAQEVTVQQIIPVPSVEADSDGAVYEFEPSEEVILKEILPQNIAVQVFSALLENAASEHAARMTAMDNATRNAGEMIKKLTLKYNRSRQAAITTELTEIISGAEAV